ncbi:ABA4-like family protein [Amycolatopsis rhabdoformis]|uniref:ABA4-like family protein n=1 Tax=Amycolatopsis rhabdoformis TaxID=1448059 RepID=A0ABZ1I4P3_9PSEU|nr:ABA4-like family protein [Amycolatopsis rhabdoformis]WSE29337.1 ABA4-like family protein [Amycolatopsis rhabdoformis]
MTQQLFTWTFPLATPFWALMIFAPTWRWTRRIMASPWVPLLPLVCYFALALPHFGELWQAASRPDLTLLQAFAGSATGAALLWAQLIAFDLFLGRWMFFEARRLGVPWWLVSPVLVLTIFLSPFGLVVFLIVRGVRIRSAP